MSHAKRKTVWVLDHYARARHEEFALLNQERYQTIRFMSAFIHNDPSAGENRTRVEQTSYGQRIYLKTLSYTKNNWKRSANMASFALQLLLNAYRSPKPDVIVASGPHLFTLFAGAIIAKLRRAQLIVEVRDLWPRTLVDLGALNPNSTMAKILCWLERTSYKAAEQIIFAIPLGHKYLEELHLQKPTTVIPNGIIQELALDKSATTVPERNQYPFLAVYAGLLGVANNVEQILDAAKILNQTQPDKFGFLIYGTGPQREHLIQRVQQEQITNVHIQEPVSRGEVLAIIRGSADATIFTLKPVDVFKYGISPNKISDYLAVAKPMVFSCRAGNDIAQLAQCGLSADPTDPRSLADAIISLSETDPKLRQQMGERGYNYMLQHYITEDHAKLFGDVVTTKREEERGLNAVN